MQANLESLGWSNTILSARSGLDRSLIGRWLNEGTQPSVESVRAVAHAFDRGVWEGLVAAGILAEDELIDTPQHGGTDLRLISDEELLSEVRRRMQRGRMPRSGEISTTEIAEEPGVDVGEIEEEGAPKKQRPRTRSQLAG